MEMNLPPPYQEDGQPVPKSLEEALTALQEDGLFVQRLDEDVMRWFVGVNRVELEKLKLWEEEAIASGMEVHKARLNTRQKMYFELL